MSTFLPILAGLLTTDVKATVHRAKRNTAIYAFVLLALVTAYTGIVVALGIHAATYFGPAAAAWLVAGIALATALALVAVVMIMNRIDRREQAKRDSGRKIMAAAALASAPTLVRSRYVPILIAAVVAGAAVAQVVRPHTSDEASG